MDDLFIDDVTFETLRKARYALLTAKAWMVLHHADCQQRKANDRARICSKDIEQVDKTIAEINERIGETGDVKHGANGNDTTRV